MRKLDHRALNAFFSLDFQQIIFFNVNSLKEEKIEKFACDT